MMPMSLISRYGVTALLLSALCGSCQQQDDDVAPDPAAPPACTTPLAVSPGQVLQTPDAAFANLEGWPFAPQYFTVCPGSLRMHYVDEGPRNGPVVLLLHGNPSWSYNYRKMIPLLTAAGYRVVAPDLIGFGRSDKPEARAVYTYNNQVAWMTSLVKGLNLSGITLFCQDWGGLVGLRVAAENEALFSRIITSNTALPRGDQPVSPALQQWITVSSPTVPLYSTVLEAQTFVTLTAGERAAYDAPFPSEAYKAGPRQMPQVIPLTPQYAGAAENALAWQVLDRWTKPFLTASSVDDAISPDADLEFQRRVPGAQGKPHIRYPNARHFIQEDRYAELSQLIIDFIRNYPV
jgi:haloalkane dehalogenase